VKRSVRLRLHDILEAIEGIESTALDMTFAKYQQSWQVRRAVEPGVEIVSEASRHVPDELKQRHPHIYTGGRSPGSAICFGTSMAGSTTGSCGAWSTGISRS